MKVAFGYKMRVGKDTSADYLVVKYGGKRISFATPLYQILHYAQAVCGFPQEKDRKFLQWVGTEWARNIDADVWVRLAMESADDGNTYVSDLRFTNEFHALKMAGWTMIKLIRQSDEVSTHVSETELDTLADSEWDHVIENDGTLEDLYLRLDHIFGSSTIRADTA